MPDDNSSSFGCLGILGVMFLAALAAQVLYMIISHLAAFLTIIGVIVGVVVLLGGLFLWATAPGKVTDSDLEALRRGNYGGRLRHFMITKTGSFGRRNYVECDWDTKNPASPEEVERYQAAGAWPSGTPAVPVGGARRPVSTPWADDAPTVPISLPVGPFSGVNRRPAPALAASMAEAAAPWTQYPGGPPLPAPYRPRPPADRHNLRGEHS